MKDWRSTMGAAAVAALAFASAAGAQTPSVAEVAEWRQAAERGESWAQFNLGLMYDNGEGVPENDAEAARWYRLAADQGDAKAQFNLGRMYATGEGVPENDAEAVRWYRLAAEQGDADAQFILGFKYATGEGVPENDAEALRWYRLAAEQGDADAQFILGLMYANGEGVPENDTEAVRWYRLAAEQGNAKAQGYLGKMYALGEGSPANYVEAYKWFALARAQGDDAAYRALDLIQQRMTPAQVAEAQALASAWRPGGGAASADAARPDDAFARAKPAPDPAVRSIQMGLGVLGYDVGPADGFDGPKTQAAIAAFGADFNVNVEALTPSDLAIAIGAAIGLTSARDTEPETDDRAGEAILTGSGFFVSAEGHLVTNAHVVEGCARVTTNAGSAASPVAIEAGVDLALLRVADWAGPAAHLRQGRGVRLGDDVVVVGYPFSGLLSSGPSVTTGSVSALAGPGDDRRFLQISAPVQPGNSGGPALDRSGAIVGVVVAKLNAASTLDAAGALPENVNFAVSLGALQAFLDAHGVDYALADPGPDLGTADVAALATPYTVQLTCEG